MTPSPTPSRNSPGARSGSVSGQRFGDKRVEVGGAVRRPALLSAFKLLAREAAADGVTFNAVLPGRIATDRLVSGYASPEALQVAAERDIPARRTGTPEEVAAAAVFLASAQASYVTGQSLLVDGGLTRSW